MDISECRIGMQVRSDANGELYTINKINFKQRSVDLLWYTGDKKRITPDWPVLILSKL